MGRPVVQGRLTTGRALASRVLACAARLVGLGLALVLALGLALALALGLALALALGPAPLERSMPARGPTALAGRVLARGRALAGRAQEGGLATHRAVASCSIPSHLAWQSACRVCGANICSGGTVRGEGGASLCEAGAEEEDSIVTVTTIQPLLYIMVK